MTKKFSVLTTILFVMASVFSLGNINPVYASTPSWYSQTYSSNNNIKITIDNPHRPTKGPLYVTIDTSGYNNGDNVILDGNTDKFNILTYNSQFKVKVTKNGTYSFFIQKKASFDPSNPIYYAEDCDAIINNIGVTGPTIKYKTYIDSFSGTEFLDVNINSETYYLTKVILPDGSVDKLTGKISGTSEEIPIYKNGNYTFKAFDSEGLSTTTTIKVTNCHPTLITVNKVTVTSKYITGRTMPNASVDIYSNNQAFVAEFIKADKKGNFKVKVAGNSKLRLNQTLYCYGTDTAKHSKYSTGEFIIKVVKK